MVFWNPYRAEVATGVRVTLAPPLANNRMAAISNKINLLRDDAVGQKRLPTLGRNIRVSGYRCIVTLS
jgi:hypothetical protein